MPSGRATERVQSALDAAGIEARVETFIDRDLLQYDRIWAAAGTPHAVFELTPEQLTNLAGGVIVEIQ